MQVDIFQAFGRTIIRNSTVLASRRPAYQKLVGTHKKSASKSFYRLFLRSKKRVVRYGVLMTNVALLAVVGVVAVRSSADDGGNPKAQLLAAPAQSVVANPLDTLSSADVAVNVARMVRMDEAVAVENKADTVNTQSAVSSADNNVVLKPQIVSTSLKSVKDIRHHIAVPGDTVSSIAAKYGVTSDTIRNSNGLRGDAVTVGTQLVISPVDGMVYNVKAGDTIDSLAARYQVSRAQLVAFNDAELSGEFRVGQVIVIPNAVQPAAATAVSRTSSYAAFTGGGGAYVRGWCTYYASARAGVPGGWGNASNWARSARAQGWNVSSVPRVGSVAQTTGMSFAGHVAIVEAVSEDGTMMKYSDMNGIAGFGRVGYSDWVPVSRYQNYIYR